MDNIKETGPDIIVLKFADSRIPTFKETRGRDYIKYGDDNLYPEYLNYLYNKSAKHNAIINGKASYIFGKGYENGNIIVNRNGETLNDIARKAILDIEIYGGYKMEVIWNRAGKIKEIYHADYSTIRKGKDCGFFYKESWKLDCRDEEVYIDGFDTSKPMGRQIYDYNEYRPGVRFYPLPGYIGSNNYIETDIEISKFHLSAIRNGMMPSKMIQFFKGEPTDEKKKEIEGRLRKKYAGAENGGQFFLVFNDANAAKSVEVTDLSASELDKQFDILNKTCQQEIFSGHLVTSPMLFGIKTEGQLGGSTELKTAYTIFQNTYAEPKANAFDNEMRQILSRSVFAGEFKLQPTDPVGIIIPDELLKQAITPDEVRDRLGLPVIEKPEDSAATKTLNAISGVSPLVATKILDNLTKNEIRGLAALPPVPNGDFIPNPDGSQPEMVAAPTLDSDINSVPANDNIKNLTAKQHQQLMRIIRQYSKGQLTELAAKALLRTGLGLTDEDINSLLGIEAQPLAMSFEQQDEVIAMFDACGDSKNDFEVLKSKRVSFSIDEIEEDETIYIKEAFKTYDVTASESKIIELIKKDPKVTSEIIAKAIGETKAFVESKIKSLTKKGYIESTIEKIGTDEIIKRIIPKSADTTPPPGKAAPTQIFIKYSYEGPQDSRNRPFCAKLMALNRLYSRAEIEKISQRLGYSVFDRGGGFWTQPDGTVSAKCRHSWVSNILIKKGGAE